MMHMVEAKVSINFGSLAFFTLFDFFFSLFGRKFIFKSVVIVCSSFKFAALVIWQEPNELCRTFQPSSELQYVCSNVPSHGFGASDWLISLINHRAAAAGENRSES